ncbi:MAG: hypothetical protein JWR26_1829 [Pedosphaera sp.]|nr:hypothetical protein [Pedosphaera sp.]
MKLFNRIPVIQTSVTVLATLVLATGCHSAKQKTYSYSGGNVPVVATAEQPQPTVAAGAPGPAYETQTGAGQAATTGQNDIVVPLQKETVSVGTQPVNEGSVTVHKITRTETINQPVQVRREVVTIDRQPAGAQASANPPATPGAQSLNTPFQDGQITVNLSRDQPVIQTQVVPAGSVVIHKQTITEPMNVQSQARSEDVEVAKSGNPSNVNISPGLNAPTPGAQGAAPGAQGAAPGFSGQTAGSAGAAGGTAAITELNQLYSAQDPSTLAGRQVNLSGVAVQDVPGEHMLTVGSGTGRSVCVRTAQPISGITKGQVVNITGVVKSVPQSISSLGLDQASAAQLQNQPIYVDASTITPANQ